MHTNRKIIIAGVLGVFASIGLGRFALGMLLPSMSESLHLSYEDMGIISTLNFTGYLLTALLSGIMASVITPGRLIFIALLGSSLSMALISRSHEFTSVAVLYTITGLGSGASNVTIMAVVTGLVASSKRGRIAGVLVAGSGAGLIFSGLLVPALNVHAAPQGWRLSWLVLSVIVLAAALVCLWSFRDLPSTSRNSPSETKTTLYLDPTLYYIGLIYFLFGFTYVIYVTFLVTYIVNEWGIRESVAGHIWAWMGVLSLLSGPLFGSISDSTGRKKALITVFLFQSFAYLTIASRLHPFMVYVSVILFGLVAWSVPSIMTALIGDLLGADRAVAGLGLITFIFGLGQISGPYVAGRLADTTGTLSSGFYLAASGTLLACFLSLGIKKRLLL